MIDFTADRAAAPVAAATVLLIRDGSAGLEVFMVVRHHQIDFAAGAMVFPGGKVALADATPALRAYCAGTGEIGPEALALRVAAIREAFEESGILLARPCGRSHLVAADEATRLGQLYRSALASGEAMMADLVAAERLEIASDLLVPFAHWITPNLMPKRYDTHFFLVAAPEDQLAIHDGSEVVESAWMSPREVLTEAAAHRCTVIFPTRMNLAKLGRSACVAEALAAARAASVVTVLPEIDLTARVLRIPPEAGYDLIEAPLEELVGQDLRR